MYRSQVIEEMLITFGGEAKRLTRGSAMLQEVRRWRRRRGSSSPST
jgi:hypothetical protein